MDYVKGNKEAWEEAFDNRSENWCSDVLARYRSEELPFIERALAEELLKLDLSGKVIGQFCCNNGRELLSIMKLGAKKGIGFDIAENQISCANEFARELGVNCEFVATDVLEIDERFSDTFDLICITIGALCWFDDLNLFFAVVSRCLKDGGSAIISEAHPVTNMLGASDEDGFDESNPQRIMYTYFEKTWKENDGMYYMTGKEYESKTFTSFTHPFSSILNGIVNNGLRIRALHEHDVDISSGTFSELNGMGIPLSYVLIADKPYWTIVKLTGMTASRLSRHLRSLNTGCCHGGG